MRALYSVYDLNSDNGPFRELIAAFIATQVSFKLAGARSQF
jgi:hypothetical protein